MIQFVLCGPRLSIQLLLVIIFHSCIESKIYIALRGTLGVL